MRRGTGPPRGGRLLGAVTAAVVVFSLLPMIIIVPISFSPDEGMNFPPEGFSTRWYEEALADEVWLRGLVTSLVIAVSATAIAGVVGVAGAYVVARFRFPGRGALAAVLVMPLMLPSVMYGLSVLLVLSSLRVRDSIPAIVMVHVILVMPYFIRVVGAMFLSADLRQLEEAARSLGATSRRTFFRVTLPSVRPGIIAGCLFAFIMSFIEFDVTNFMISGNIVTLPIAIFRALSYLYSPVVAAVSSILLLLSVVLIFSIDRVAGLGKSVRL
jgi:putative spermidine/putrescine transport system permease protein